MFLTTIIASNVVDQKSTRSRKLQVFLTNNCTFLKEEIVDELKISTLLLNFVKISRVSATNFVFLEKSYLTRIKFPTG